MSRSKWESDLAQMRADRYSTSVDRARMALELLTTAVSESEPIGAISYRKWLLRTGRELIGALPDHATVLRMVNDMLWATDEAVSAAEMHATALRFLQVYQERQMCDEEQLAKHAADRLSDYGAVMVYAHNSLVRRSLILARAHRDSLHVLCSEGRPLLKGTVLAAELSAADVKVTIGVDMALFGWLDRVQALVVGAEALSTEGVLAKLGVAALVGAAVERGIPCYVLCRSVQFLPMGFSLANLVAEGDPSQVMPQDSGAVVSNVMHSIAPLAPLTVITEAGELDTESLLRQLRAVRVYSGLRHAS